MTAGLQLSCANASWRLVVLDSVSLNDCVVFSTTSADDHSHTLDDALVENIDQATTSCEMDLSWGSEVVAMNSNVIVRQIQSVSNARFVEVYDGDMNYVATLKGVLMADNVTDGTTRYMTDLSVINLMLNNQRRIRLKFLSIKSGTKKQLTIMKLTVTLHKPVEAATKGIATTSALVPPPTLPESTSSINSNNNVFLMAQVELMTSQFLREMESLLDRKLAPVLNKLEALQTQLDNAQAKHVVQEVPMTTTNSSDITTVVPQLSPAVAQKADICPEEIETLQVDRIAASASSDSDVDLELKNDMKSLMMMLRRGGINNEG